MGRVERTFRIQPGSGLHVRPATVFVRTAEKYESKITVRHDKATVNAKSVLGLMTLAAGPNDKLTLTAKGPDALAAVEELGKLILRNFEEEKCQKQDHSKKA